VATVIEKRNFSRVDFKKEVEIHICGKKSSGFIENLSLKGAYIKTTYKLQEGDQVEIVIHLAGDDDFDIYLQGKVVRLTEDGAGIIFEKLDLGSFSHLRNIIAYNYGDDDAVMEEFFNYHNNEN
jgi:hypothetical protein